MHMGSKQLYVLLFDSAVLLTIRILFRSLQTHLSERFHDFKVSMYFFMPIDFKATWR
jgi:hypothetical protein